MNVSVSRAQASEVPAGGDLLSHFTQPAEDDEVVSPLWLMELFSEIDELQLYSPEGQGYKKLQTRIDEDCLTDLFDVDAFDALLTSGVLVAPHLDLISNGRRMPAPFTKSHSPTADVDLVLNHLKSSGSIRVAHIENYLPSVGRLVRSLEEKVGFQIRANLYLTPPFSRGFNPHFDPDDSIVIQVHGHKTWSMFASYVNQVDIPERAQTFDQAKHVPDSIPEEFEMQPGDLLHIRRGVMHQARTEEGYSIHLTFAMQGLTVAEVMMQLLAGASQQSALLRRYVCLADLDKQPELPQLDFTRLRDQLMNDLAKHRICSRRGDLSAAIIGSEDPLKSGPGERYEP